MIYRVSTCFNHPNSVVKIGFLPPSTSQEASQQVLAAGLESFVATGGTGGPGHHPGGAGCGGGGSGGGRAGGRWEDAGNSAGKMMET